MKRPTVFLITGLYLLLPILLSSQVSITGIITDGDGEVIIGANIYLENTYDGTSSGVNGEFRFTTSEQGEQTLIVTYLGYAETRKNIRIAQEAIELRITLKENAVELQKVVITAGAYDAGGVNKREILKPLDILTTAGATGDIAGALNTLPGTQTVGESGRLFVRGGEGYETKTFIDGLQVMNFYSISAPNTPGRSRFMPYMFSGTSFSTGGYSAEYGQALSSALILNSKFKATQQRTDISLMSVGADIGTSRVWEKASLSAKAQYTNLDPYMSLINQEIDWIDAPTSLNGSVAYRRQISTSGILKVFGNFNRSGFELNQYGIGDPTITTPTETTNGYTYLNAMIQEVIGNGWQIRGGASFTHNRDDIRPAENHIRENEGGIHTKVTLEKTLSSQLKIKMGGEFFHRNFYQDYQQPTENFFNRYEFTEQLAGLFAETDIYLTSSLLARVGLRSEYSGLNQKIHLAPRLSLALKTSESGQLSAAFGQFQQSAQNRWLMVNDQLEQEKADHFILNYQISQENRTFRMEIYYKKYRDLVKFQSGSAYQPSASSNSGDG
ncbi:MAG: TonB-dependent receptor, partial [Lewinella sp.]|nr:TonB-dependent receptor [Lewinella sp.]